MITEEILSSKIYDLAQPFTDDMPILTPKNPRYFYGLFRQHGNSGSELSFSSGLIHLSDHLGSHIDALCHVSYKGKLFDNTDLGPNVETAFGYSKLGAEAIPPLVRRGILLDIASHKKVDILPKGYEISVDDMNGFCRDNNLAIPKDGVVLVRVGNGKYWAEPKLYPECAGVAEESNFWLSKAGISAVGIDNIAWDLLEGGFPGHRHLIVEKGIYIMENLYLEELSRDRCYSFLFVGIPLKIKGATGSPIRPIALRM